VAGRDDAAVVFVVERRGAEIDQSNVRTFHTPDHPLLSHRLELQTSSVRTDRAAAPTRAGLRRRSCMASATPRRTSRRVSAQWRDSTRKLCYRKDDRAMCLIYECPESFETPWLRLWILFQNCFDVLLLWSTLRMSI